MPNSNAFVNFQLYKALPKLSGNMQIDLIVEPDGDDLFIKGAHLRPISNRINFVPVVDERIMDKTHQFNISRFYKKIQSSFFESPIEPSLASDWPIMLSNKQLESIKYLKTWDDTYWTGIKRMCYKLYGATHEAFVPMWLEQVQSNLVFIVNNHQLKISREKTGHEFHDEFCEYLFDYFEYCRICSGNNNVINIDFKRQLANISGLYAMTGIYSNINDYNLVKNLMYRTRPLLEANSIITNTFPNHGMICPQHINFNICFNSDDLKIPISGSIISIKTSVDDEEIPLIDFYTNHAYVPRAKRLELLESENYSQSDPYLNVLDFKNDNKSTELMHKNKMVQSICHWNYVDRDNILFNVYDGFGLYWTEGTGANQKILTESHNYGEFGTRKVPSITPGRDKRLWPTVRRTASFNPGVSAMGESETDDTLPDLPDLIYFQRSIVPRNDNSLLSTAREITWLKYNESNEYVLRYSGKIRPAFYESPRTSDDEIAPGYGRNFLYEKLVLLPASSGLYNTHINNFINTGMPPRYPSLNYDSVQAVVSNDCLDGDINYNDPHPKCLGKIIRKRSVHVDNSLDKIQYDTETITQCLSTLREEVIRPPETTQPYSLRVSDQETAWNFLNQLFDGGIYEPSSWIWPEYKWFNVSYIRSIPQREELEITVTDNSKSNLENQMVDVMFEKLNDPSQDPTGTTNVFDKYFLKTVYDIDYYLQNVQWDKESEYRYHYKIVATLK